MTATRHLVDTQLLTLLDMLPAVALTVENLEAMRAPNRLPIPPAGAEAAKVRMQVKTIPGPEGAPEIGVIVYQPAATTTPVGCIFHIHGGGYVAGSAASMEPTHRTLVSVLDCVIVSVDYRLAPETRFPGAIEDCYAGLAWTFANAEALGIDRSRIGIMGESAGGGLAAGLALLARDRGEYALAFQHLIYPMIDDRTCTTSDPHPWAGEYVWTPHNNHFGWSAILGVEPGSEGVSPYAAAARAEDLSGLPPTFLSTGSLDLFLEEDLEYARRLLRAGVPTEFHIYPGGFHAFNIHPTADIAVASRNDSTKALARALK